MYVYLINDQKITFETELEAADAIIEAETNGFSWELVSEGPGDPTVKTEEETIENAVLRIVDYINNKLKLDQ
mgnify:CR=1 FL=1